MLHVHPVIPGSGIPLFPPGGQTVALEFLGSQVWESGLVKLDYSLKTPHSA